MKRSSANNSSSKIYLLLLAFAISITMIASGVLTNAYADEGNPENWDWYKYANNSNNNSVIDRKTPISPDETQLKWTLKLGKDWDASPTPPLINDKYLYMAVGSRVVQVNKETGKETELSKKERAPFYQGRNVGYAMNPMLYAEGKFFVQIEGGAMQCVDANTLEPLWVATDINTTGQTVSNISYKKIDGVGYVFSGTWNGEDKDGTFYGVKIDDKGITKQIADVTMVNSKSKEQKAVTYNVKKPAWTFTPSKDDKFNTGESNRQRGFYWAGAYVTDKYLAIGTDDGTNEGNYVKGASVYTLNPKTGKIIDSITDIVGDIRTSISYDNGYIYYSTKGGHLHKTKISEDGKLGKDSYVDVGGMTTATPLIYKNRIYIGVSGKSQFDPNSEHRFVVIDNSKPELNENSIVYSQDIPGYPQATPVLTTAYENEDFDKSTPGPDGRVYVYFTYNAKPGGIYAFYDFPGAKEAPIKDAGQLLVFIPEKDKQQFCISPITVDKDGTMYYKNDSGNIFAVSKGGPALKSLDITDDTGNSVALSDGKPLKDIFHHNNREYTVNVKGVGDSIKVNAVTKNNEELTINGKKAVSGKPFNISLNASGKTDVDVKVAKNGNGITYTVHVVSVSDNPNAYDIMVTPGSSTPPWLGTDNQPLKLTPSFNKDETREMASKPDEKVRSNRFANIWVTPEVDNTKIEAEPLDNVAGEIGIHNVNVPNQGHKASRLSVEAKDKNKDVKVKIIMTSESGKATKTYLVTIGRQYHVDEVKLNKASLTLDKDAEETLTCSVKPTNADNKEVEWSTSNPNVATVDANGKVTGVSAGKADIKVTSKDGKKVAICKVTVNAPVQDPIKIHLSIVNQTAVNNLKDDYGFVIDIPDSSKGEIVKNKEITLNDGENLIDAIQKELKASNIKYNVSGDGKTFSEIAGLKSKINISSSIKKDGGKIEGDMSGWEYTLNNKQVNCGLNQMKHGAGLGANDIKLSNNDIVKISYTVDGETFDKEYKQSFKLDDSIKNLNLTVGETYMLPADKIKVEPENWLWARQYGQYFCMSDKEKVATVSNDNTGIKITAKSEGKTTVIVQLPNELSQEITVNVKPKTTEKPEPRILIDGAVWDMNKTFETTSQGPHSLKVQIKKNGDYVDVDTKKIKWEITNGVTSRVNGQAFWITVDHEATFKATLEEYPSENVFFKAKLKPASMTDFEVKLPTTYKIGAWNNLVGSWSSKTGGGYFVGISEGEGTDNYKIVPTPANASNTEVTWEALTPEIATYMEQFKNGIIPVRGGTAKFKVSSKANPQLSKVIELKLDYKVPMKSAEFIEKEIFLRPEQTIKDIGLRLTPLNPSEQRFDWTFDNDGIVDIEEIVESTGQTGDLPKFIHKITALKEGTVTATATPWDQTGGAKPIQLKIHVQKVTETSKADLERSINTANEVKSGIRISDSGKDVEPKDKWTTAEEMAALEKAIKAAEAVNAKADANQDEIDKAKTDLEKAMKKFTDSLKDGKKTQSPTPGTDPQNPSEPGTPNPGTNPSDNPANRELKVVTEGQNDSSTVAKGSAVIYTVGDSDSAVFRILGEDLKVKDLESVLLDGRLVDPSNYDVRQGSIIVSFKKAYLDTLKAGRHEVTFNTTKGIAKAELVIKDKTKSHITADTNKKKTANTGDSSDAVAYSLIVITALGAAYYVLRKRRNS